MVSTRSTSVAPTRRRSLVTIFDQAAARHAHTPGTPATAAQPAGGSAAAAFVAAVRTLMRTQFDESTAKHVAKKCLGGKEGIFYGRNEKNAASLFVKLVPALMEKFVSQEPAFNFLFALDDATVTVRVESNKLLFFTLALLGQSEMLSVRLLANEDPHNAIADFNAALATARRRSPLDDEDIKSQFISAMDPAFYAAARSRLLLHDQRATGYVFGQNDCEHNSADNDLLEIILGLRKEVKQLSDRVNAKGFTPRADKPRTGREMKYRLFAALPLPTEGNWSQGTSKKVAFHKGTGQTIPLCGNATCMESRLRHWHRNCPRGGGPRAGAHSFSPEHAEGDFFAVQFQHAIDTGDNDRFQALCLLAGGKPELFDDFSTCSFDVDDAVLDEVEEYMQYCQPADTHMGVCSVGGDAVNVHINSFQTVDGSKIPPPVQPAVTATGSPSVVSECTAPHPVDPLHTQIPDLSFADHIARMGGFTVEAGDQDPTLKLGHVRIDDGVSDVSSEDSDGGEIRVAAPLRGCGRPLPAFGKSARISLMVCSVFLFRATTAAPITAAFDSVPVSSGTALPAGGAAAECSFLPLDCNLTPPPCSIDFSTIGNPLFCSTNDPLLGSTTARELPCTAPTFRVYISSG
ncbi:hypothetical protein CYMTET_15214 [Cymbomonas tetramitiformis]|uniref:Uncharacterized protein n=1 Tax=Cymbomonas tetramitiformis TaxID=36881 RepID=A0AAE0L9K2_9CHLO|nr:hypothetical protein CYMTET_15214 [Cymbomonas tetramitiformis]